MTLDGAAGPVEGAPEAPQNLVATLVAPAVELTWDVPASDGGSAITGYQIESEVDGGGFTILVADTVATATTYSDSTYVDGTTTSYRVSAINAVGAGAVSNIATVTPPTVPSITPSPKKTADPDSGCGCSARAAAGTLPVWFAVALVVRGRGRRSKTKG